MSLLHIRIVVYFMLHGGARIIIRILSSFPSPFLLDGHLLMLVLRIKATIVKRHVGPVWIADWQFCLLAERLNCAKAKMMITIHGV